MIKQMMLCMGMIAFWGFIAVAEESEFQVDSMTFPLANDYIHISDNGYLENYEESGTVDDPYVIKDLNLKDHTGNGIVIENTDAHILIKNCTMTNLNDGYNALLPVCIDIEEVENVRVEDCRTSDDEIRVSNAENVQFKDINCSVLMFDGVNKGVIEECVINHIVIEATGTFITYSEVFPLEEARIPSQNCLIKDCKVGQEILFSDSKNCTVEGCVIKGRTVGVGLWMFNPNNVTFRNDTVINGTLGIHRTLSDPLDLTFDGLKLINLDIYITGLNSKDSIDLTNSTSNGKEIFYHENEEGLVLGDLEFGYVWLMNCSKSRIEGIKTLGISAINSSGLVVENSEIQQGGIYLAFSNDCLTSNNTLINSSARAGGITLGFGCRNITLQDNVVKRLIKTGSDYLTSLGIDISLSEGNHTISSNVIVDGGIGIDVGKNNTIFRNTVANNVIGIKVSDDYNKIAQNNFLYNGIDAQQESTSLWKVASFANNNWNGNFWTSYQGVDEDDDGIGDSPHIVPAEWFSTGGTETLVE